MESHKWRRLIPNIPDEKSKDWLPILRARTYKIGIVEGPPGTGKTRVIGMTAVICLSENHKFLVVAVFAVPFVSQLKQYSMPR